MSVAALIADMVAAGVPAELIGRTAELLAARQPAADEQAQRRREADRVRQAEKRAAEKAERLRMSADSADVRRQTDGDLPPPVSPLSPSPTPLTQNPPLSPTIPPAAAGASALDGDILPPIAKPKPPPSASRGCRLPPGFPGDAEREWTIANLRFSHDDFAECRDEFRDYWAGVPGQRGVKCDWPGTFRNAARKFRPRGRSRQAHAAGNQFSDGSTLGAYQRAAARVRAANDVSERRSGLFGDGGGELDVLHG